MQTLSKDAEQAIISAVKRAVVLVDDRGLTPDAAVEKVARDAGWGPAMIRFASCAYNTGRQTAQRETADDALGKFAEFPLVDPDRVIAAIWPETVKSASDARLDAVSSEYALPPQWLAPRASAEKRASLHALTPKQAADTVAIAPLNPAGRAYNQYRMLKRAAEEARYQAAHHYDRLVSSLGQLADYFKKDARDRLSLAEFELGAARKYGSAGTKLVDFVVQRNRSKEARYDPAVKLARLVRFEEGLAPWCNAKACVGTAALLAEKRAASEAAAAALDAYVRDPAGFAAHAGAVRREKSGSALLPESDRLVVDENVVGAFSPRPFVQDPSRSKQASTPPPPGPWSILDGGGTKEANLGRWAGFAAVNAGTQNLLNATLSGGPSREEQVTDQWNELEDPAHDAELNRIRTQAMMADLMKDEVISGYPPHEVARAFNEISQMAPRVARQPLAVRTQMRRYLQGNMQPFETREIVDIENALKNTEKDAPGPGAIRPPAPDTRILNDQKSQPILR